MITYRFARNTYAHLSFSILASFAAVQSMKINRHRTLIVQATERVEALESGAGRRVINIYATRHHHTEAEIIGETEKAYKLRRLGDRRFDLCAGRVAWLPKRVLVPMISTTDGRVVEGFYETARWF